MRTVLGLVVLLLLGVEAADAQRRPMRVFFSGNERPTVEFGVRGGYDFDSEVGSAGAQLRVPLIDQLLLVPSGDVFFAGDESETAWQLNADVVVRPDAMGGLYGGVGAAFLRADFDGDDDEEVEAGYNLFAGIQGSRLLDTRVRPFAEARWSWVDDFDPFRLVVGINTPVR